MNAIRLAERLEQGRTVFNDMSDLNIEDDDTDLAIGTAAAMLRKQDAAIKTLREATQIASDALPDIGRVQKALKAALAATEKLNE